VHLIPSVEQSHPKLRGRIRRRFRGLGRLSPALFVFSLIAGALAGCVPPQEHTQTVSDRDKWKASTRTLENENTQLRDVLDKWIQSHKALEKRVRNLSARPSRNSKKTEQENRKLKKRVRNYERETEILEARVQNLKEDRDVFRNWYRIYRQRFNQAVLREQRLQRKSKVYERMVKNLEKEVSKGQLKLEEVQGRLTVSVAGQIVFEPGGVVVNPSGRAVLDKLAKLLKGITDKRIQVEGHTDNLPVRPESGRRYRNNWELSTLRAAAVVRYLHEKGGVDPTLLSSAGYGPYQPVATNETSAGRRKNRRIEIVLTPLPKRTITRPLNSGDSSAQGPAASPSTAQ